MTPFAIRRLTSSDLDYVPEPPVFHSLVAQDVQGLDNEFSGYDSDALNFGNALANEPDEGSQMDNALTDLAFNPGNFQAANFDPVVQDYAGFVPGAEGLLVNNENGLGVNPSPGGGTPAPQPTPSPTGTGGTPAPNCTSDYSTALLCNFTAAQIASFYNGLVWRMGRIQQQCPLFTYDINSTQAAGQAVLNSVTIQSGDPTVLTPSIKVVNQGTGGPLAYLLHLAFTTTKAGHFEFILATVGRDTPTTRLVGVCIDIGT